MTFEWVKTDYWTWQYMPPMNQWDGHPVASVVRTGPGEWYWHPSGEWGVGLVILGEPSGMRGPYKTAKEAKKVCEAHEKAKGKT